MVIKTKTGPISTVPQGAVVMLGYFDGFHKGHMALADAAYELKEQKNAPCVMLWTFTRLHKGKTITDNEEKVAAFFSYCSSNPFTAGCEDPVVVFEDFSNISHLTGEEFVRDVLYGTFRVSAVICGFNFRFGTGGASGSADLERYCNALGIPCKVVSPVTADGATISSTDLRQLIASGEVETAAERMGRAYSVTSEVVRGKQIGHTLGFPTVNQRIPEDKVIPAYGVYTCRVTLPNGSVKYGVCNVGYRPTVNGDKGDVTLETHIFDYNGDLYGEKITVALCRKLRDEVRFDSREALSLQIAADKENAKEYFERSV